MGTNIFGPLQALATKRFYFGDLSLNCRIQNSFWKFGKCSKRLSVTKSNIRGQLYLRVVVTQSGCSRAFLLWTKDLVTFYFATPKIFIMILSALFVPLETVQYALLFFWKLWDFRKLLTEYMLISVGFVVGSLENFPLRKWPSLVKMSLRWNLRQAIFINEENHSRKKSIFMRILKCLVISWNKM